MKIKSGLGAELEKLLTLSGVTKGELAVKLGVSPSTVTQYFDAKSPSVDTMLRICDACGVKGWQFMASLETGIPADMFKVLESLYELPSDKRIIVLRLMRDGIELATGRN